MTTGQASIRLIRYRPLLFLSTIFFRGLDDLMPFFDGIIRKAFFDTLTGESGAGALTLGHLLHSSLSLILPIAVSSYRQHSYGARWRYAVSTLLRKNLTTAIMNMSAPT